MSDIQLTVQRITYDRWDLTLSSQDVVGYATDAGIPGPMPRHGEEHGDWIDRIVENDRFLAHLISGQGTPDETDEELEIHDGPYVVE